MILITMNLTIFSIMIKTKTKRFQVLARKIVIRRTAATVIARLQMVASISILQIMEMTPAHRLKMVRICLRDHHLMIILTEEEGKKVDAAVAVVTAIILLRSEI